MEKFSPNIYSSFSEADQHKYYHEMMNTPVEMVFDTLNKEQRKAIFLEAEKISGADKWSVVGTREKMSITFYIDRWNTDALNQMEALGKRIFPEANK
jgi:hypothetical protein